MNQVIASSSFKRQARKLVRKNPKLGQVIAEVLMQLVDDPSHYSLRLHKLVGHQNWSVFVTQNIRIILFIEGDQIFCTQIGTHDQVY